MPAYAIGGAFRLRPWSPLVSGIAGPVSPDHSTLATITKKHKSGPIFKHFLEDFHSLTELGEFFVCENFQMRGQVRNTQLTPFLQ